MHVISCDRMSGPPPPKLRPGPPPPRVIPPRFPSKVPMLVKPKFPAKAAALVQQGLVRPPVKSMPKACPPKAKAMPKALAHGLRPKRGVAVPRGDLRRMQGGAAGSGFDFVERLD